MIFVYLPPYGANHSAYTSDEDNGILLLESYINQVELKFPNTDLLVSGDFNARTKDCPDFIIDDSAEYIPLPDDYEEDRFSMPRNSKDLHGEVNIHGKSLLNLCCTHNIHMLNGRIVGDLPGHLTCFTANGCSIVDYTVASSSLFPLIHRFEIGDADDYTHLPQLTQINMMEYLNADEHSEAVEDRENYNRSSKTRTFYKWTKESLEKMLHSRHLQEFNEHMDHDNVTEAIKSFNCLIQDSCEMKSSRHKSRKKSSNEWWDNEMACLKYNKYKALRMLRLESNESALLKYRNIRKLYKSKIKEKKENLKQSLRCAVETCSSASEFWKFVKSRSRSNQCVNHISTNEWKMYFDELLNSEIVVDDEFKKNVEEYISWHANNCNVCISETSA